MEWGTLVESMEAAIQAWILHCLSHSKPKNHSLNNSSSTHSHHKFNNNNNNSRHLMGYLLNSNSRILYRHPHSFHNKLHNITSKVLWINRIVCCKITLRIVIASWILLRIHLVTLTATHKVVHLFLLIPSLLGIITIILILHATLLSWAKSIHLLLETLLLQLLSNSNNSNNP